MHYRWCLLGRNTQDKLSTRTDASLNNNTVQVEHREWQKSWWLPQSSRCIEHSATSLKVKHFRCTSLLHERLTGTGTHSGLQYDPRTLFEQLLISCFSQFGHKRHARRYLKHECKKVTVRMNYSHRSIIEYTSKMMYSRIQSYESYKTASSLSHKTLSKFKLAKDSERSMIWCN